MLFNSFALVFPEGRTFFKSQIACTATTVEDVVLIAHHVSQLKFIICEVDGGL